MTRSTLQTPPRSRRAAIDAEVRMLMKQLPELSYGAAYELYIKNSRKEA
jgi:hypothetical protein